MNTFDASNPNPPICIIRCVSSMAAQEAKCIPTEVPKLTRFYILKISMQSIYHFHPREWDWTSLLIQTSSRSTWKVKKRLMKQEYGQQPELNRISISKTLENIEPSMKHVYLPGTTTHIANIDSAQVDAIL